MKDNLVLIPSQRALICSQAKYRHVIGGIGSGMSTGIMYLTALVAQAFMNNRIFIGRTTWPVLRDTSLFDFKNMLATLGITYEYNLSKQTIKLGNGTVIMFRYLNDFAMHKELELGMFVIESLDEIPVEIYNHLRTRLNKTHLVPSRDFYFSDLLRIFGKSWERMSITSSPGKPPKWIRDIWQNPTKPLYESIRFNRDGMDEHLPSDFVESLDELNPKLQAKFVDAVWE